MTSTNIEVTKAEDFSYPEEWIGHKSRKFKAEKMHV